MNRKELQELAEIRIKEAEILLKSECYDGAYIWQVTALNVH
ncbi:hypothetical protein B4064_1455 [Caldibacillus thermoamylovorans]|jgi:hypothetical protein|uniref:HEPN domain-containing protein n=1 Tax=Caldibacillus thermoamylovorans TaxID=35841 RepID=A0A090KW15_9BACI|nr:MULTISPECIES: hypothetical protein [Bacillaceae]KIO69017.1 hypothetical protein B4064_1455 [Caldibacillus thermoamylovorans]MDL0421523.1 hypothetical protein [Caldibacillus thermoamylovorans]CEE02879.1 hypothetical protein BT1A1_3093 [Caldibacillus thermoamylovorans]